MISICLSAQAIVVFLQVKFFWGSKMLMMLFDMNLKEVLSEVGLVTSRTLVRFYILMSSLVISLVTTRRESLRAEGAAERFAACMWPEVDVEIGLVIEDLWAPWKVAHDLFLSGGCWLGVRRGRIVLSSGLLMIKFHLSEEIQTFRLCFFFGSWRQGA